ncbi:MAG: hypothetical protein RLZZ558_822 [Planctomycetota bacterium]|jgi:tetratricopeptide (TPR) repeat protein
MRSILLGILLAMAAAPWTGAMAQEPSVDSPSAETPETWLSRVEDLRKRVTLEATEQGQREAADELLSVRRQLMLQHAQDPRLALWIGDYAEDCFTLCLPAGGDVDRVLYGLAGAEARQRVRATVRDMLVAAERAEQVAKATVAREGDATPPREVADRLAHVERPRRIPLLRSLAEVLQVEVGEFESAKRRAMAESAIARVESLLPELDDRTASVVARYAGLAAARIEDERAANRLLTLARERAGDDEALVTLADLAALRAAGLLRGPGPAADAAGLLGRGGSPARRLALAELEARLRRQQQQGDAGLQPEPGAAVPSWTSPFTRLLQDGTPQSAAAIRDAAIARLARVESEGTALPPSEPMGLLGLTQHRLDAGVPADDLLAALEAVRARPLTPASVRAAATRAVAGIEMVRENWGEAADRFVTLAAEHPDDPAAQPAIEAGVRILRELDRAADGQDPQLRQRLESALQLAVDRFAASDDHALWMLERQVLALEAQADGRGTEAFPVPERVPEGAEPASLHARGVAAAAWLAVQAGDMIEAERLLQQAPPPLGPSAARRRLRARVAAMASLDRDLSTDPEIGPLAARDAELLRRVIVERLAALRPEQAWPVEAAASTASGGAQRLSAMLERLPSADAADWLVAGDLLRHAGEHAAAVRAYERSLAIQTDTREALLGKAESLRVLAGDEGLREAMAIYRRVAAGDGMSTEASQRDHVWWLCQLRQLQVLQAAGRFDDRASMRVNRLRAVDPELGGPLFAEAFAALPAGDDGSRAGREGVDR